mmetsp:Transcript_16779/g.58638  ORF Transcript_16779/g.58638 Transcript_16779/m.58638 type:complete len:213 (+) Transcript_16779:2153-2791(+)
MEGGGNGSHACLLDGRLGDSHRHLGEAHRLRHEPISLHGSCTITGEQTAQQCPRGGAARVAAAVVTSGVCHAAGSCGGCSLVGAEARQPEGAQALARNNDLRHRAIRSHHNAGAVVSRTCAQHAREHLGQVLADDGGGRAASQQRRRRPPHHLTRIHVFHRIHSRLTGARPAVLRFRLLVYFLLVGALCRTHRRHGIWRTVSCDACICSNIG